MKKNLIILLASCVIFSPLMALNASNLSSDANILARGGGRGGGGGGRAGVGGGRVGVNRGIDRTPGIGRPSTVAGAAVTGRAISNRNAAYGNVNYYSSYPYYTCDPYTTNCPY